MALFRAEATKTRKICEQIILLRICYCKTSEESMCELGPSFLFGDIDHFYLLVNSWWWEMRGEFLRNVGGEKVKAG